MFNLIVIIIISQFGFAQDIFTNELNGTYLTYQYSGGNAYNIKMEDDKLSYRFLSGSKPEVWWGPFPYKTVKTIHDEYMIAWYEEGYGDYITLLINIEGKYLFGSGLIFAKNGLKKHFENAQISKVLQE